MSVRTSERALEHRGLTEKLSEIMGNETDRQFVGFTVHQHYIVHKIQFKSVKLIANRGHTERVCVNGNQWSLLHAIL